MPTIHLVEGPVGAGKSTFAAKLALSEQAPHLDLDEWMVTLFRPDRPAENFLAWYGERKSRCIEQIWRVALETLNAGHSVVLELGLVQRAARSEMYHRIAGTDHPLQVYWLDVPEAIRRQRVISRNQQAHDESQGTFKMEVTDEVFAMANAAWEAPARDECDDYNIQIVDDYSQKEQTNEQAE